MERMKQNLYYYAFLMLVRNRAKLLVMLLAMVFSTFIIIQQPAIYKGVSAHIVGLITDHSQVDLWVMDKGAVSIEHYRPIQNSYLYRVRSLPNVLWAQPMQKFIVLGTHIQSGERALWNLIGVDKERLVAAPPVMVAGDVRGLVSGGKTIIDVSDRNFFKKSDVDAGKRKSIEIGDAIDFRNVSTNVIGIGKSTTPFLMYPLLHTDYDTAATIANDNRPTFILVKMKEGADMKKLIAAINEIGDLRAYTPEQFKASTLNFILYNTAIFFNFALVVLLGYIIGFAIVAIIFFNFISDHLYQFGTLKALGAKNKTILAMVFSQAMIVGIAGYFLGLLFAMLFGIMFSSTKMAYVLSTNILMVSFLSIIFICIFSALLATRHILKFNIARVFEA